MAKEIRYIKGLFVSLNKANDMEFKSLPQVLEYFRDEQTCISFLEKQRWDGKPVCPHCSHEKVYRTNRGFKCADKKCNKKFSVTVGTVFENSKIKLSLWFAAIYLATAHKKGISSLQLSRDLGITQKTAWFMLHRIREMLRAKESKLLSGEVQADETFVGGKLDRMNKETKRKVLEKFGKQTGGAHKKPVLGMIEKDGMVQCFVIDKAIGSEIKPLLVENIDKDAIVVTDGFGGYYGLDKMFAGHVIINHDKGEYVKDGFHTNTIEGFWSIFKRGYTGIYHYMSNEHLSRYMDEFTYRYNTRDLKDGQRFVSSLRKAKGRLTYDKLTDNGKQKRKAQKTKG